MCTPKKYFKMAAVARETEGKTYLNFRYLKIYYADISQTKWKLSLQQRNWFLQKKSPSF